eukprot:TRINITY_DN3759_c2_g2_i1.p1 TRINITY_DN3759_c2_g2~~TRINITY_DN3759_c2_g2_i1.p1  ORF type:complete len:857 (+),score=191.53 TRINITY_DN3759_c2_g2_i1:89-2659(+)
MPSIKFLSTSLVLMCIVLTAFICTFLAIRSSDAALDDTKESRDTSVDSCFDIGEESVQNRTTEYLELMLSNVVDEVKDLLEPHVLFAGGVVKELQAVDVSKVLDWNYHNPARYYWAMRNLRASGCTDAGILLRSNVQIHYEEDPGTLNALPSEYHDIDGLFNFGDGHPDGGPAEYFESSVDELTGAPIIDSPFVINRNKTSCKKESLESKGAIPDEPCHRSGGDTTEYDTHLMKVYSAWIIGPNNLNWLPMQIKGDYLAVNMIGPIFHNWALTGWVQTGADLRSISKYLQGVEIGGPVGDHPSRSRIFITIRKHGYDSFAAGLLVGASHGSVTALEDDSVHQSGKYKPIKSYESSDNIIMSIGNIIEEDPKNKTDGLDLDGLVESNNVTNLNITTELAPEGEDFFYRVGRLKDNYLTDWYVHVAMDRAYVLGSIDTKTAETKDAITAAGKKVDDDLADARVLLYILVAVTAVGLILISVAFIMRIIMPLEILEKEMALVALMKLEMINTRRPLSGLQEVRLMQISFLQMMKNLVEYRNYMPASVLQDDVEEENDETSEETTISRVTGGGKSESLKLSKLSDSSSLHAMRNHAISGTEARHKKVTLLACNMLSFLNGQGDGATQLLKGVADYLTMALHYIKNSKGVPDSFNGDRLFASWNGVRACSSYRTAAYNCARGISRDQSTGKRFSIGIVSGEVRCGNMGCDGMKKYTFVGSLASWVHIVERVGRIRGADVAIDNVVREEVATVAFTRSLQHVVFTKHAPGTLMIYQAMHEKEVREEEWMYQLEAGNSSDPYKAYNMSYEQFMDKNIESARKSLEDVQDDNSEVLKQYKLRLSQAQVNPIVCEPMGKTDKLVS